MFRKDIWIKTFLALDEHRSRAVALHCNFDAFERSYTFITAYYLLFYNFVLFFYSYTFITEMLKSIYKNNISSQLKREREELHVNI